MTEAPDPTGLGLSFSGGRSTTPDGRGVSKITELLRCYYNFVRPHRALKFGGEVRTLALAKLCKLG
jgi:hypothetical protein